MRQYTNVYCLILYDLDYEHYYQENKEKSEVEQRELLDVIYRFFGVVLCIFSEGYKTCERGYKRADAADIYTDQERTVIFGKLREKDCRGHIAYDLTGEGAEYQRALFHKHGHKILNYIYPSHIARKYKEENEGQKQWIVHFFQRVNIKYCYCDGNNQKSDEVGDPTENYRNRKGKEQKIYHRASTGQSILLV